MLQNQLHMLQEETVAARQQLAASQHSCVLRSARIIQRLMNSCLVQCFELWQENTREQISMKVKSRLEVVLAMQQVCVCVCVWVCVWVWVCVCVCVLLSGACASSATAAIHCEL